MSRHEDDREDLMREAVALVRRIELCVSGENEPVTAGWRATGWFSIYFGQDPAYHFDEQGRLRRAYAQGELYRTQGSTLARLHRTRSEHETTLVRHDLSPHELGGFLDTMRQRLAALRNALAQNACEVSRTTGCAAELPEDLLSTLEMILSRREPLAAPIARR